jgi:hypothetical protein
MKTANLNFLSFLFLIFISSVARSQSLVDLTGSENLFDAVDIYMSSGALDRPDSLKSGADREIERCFQMWTPRLYPHGDFGIANAAIQQYRIDLESGAKGGGCANSFEFTDWEEIGPIGKPEGAPGVGRLQRIKFDPGYDGVTNTTVYASSEHSGLWKSTNTGGFWTQLNTDLGIPFTSVSDFSIDPNNNMNLILSTGLADVSLIIDQVNVGATNPIWTMGIYKSTDGGLTWNPINSGLSSLLSQNSAIRKLDYSPTDSAKAYALTSQGLYVTQDLTQPSPTWINITSTWVDDGELKGFEFEPGDETHLYMSGTDIYESTDAGQTWSSMTGDTVGLNLQNLPDDFEVKRINIATTAANSDLVYAYIVGESYVLVNTSDGPEWQWRTSSFIYLFDGISWSQLDYDVSSSASDIYPPAWMGMAVSPVEEDFLVYGHTFLRGRRTASASISTLSLYNSNQHHPDVHDIAFSPVGTNPFFIEAHHGGASRGDVPAGDMELDNNDITYTYLYDGLGTGTNWGFDVNDGSDEAIVVGVQDNGTIYRETGMTNWDHILDADGMAGAMVAPADPYAYYTTQSGRLRTRKILPAGSQSTVTKPLMTEYLDDEGNPESTKIPARFDAVHVSLTGQDFLGFSEVFERLQPQVGGGLPWTFFWGLSSDIQVLPIFGAEIWGNNVLWRHQISSLEVSQKNPDKIYISVGGMNRGIGMPPSAKPTLMKSVTGFTDGTLDEANPTFIDITSNLPTVNTGLAPPISGIAIDPNDDDHV